MRMMILEYAATRTVATTASVTPLVIGAFTLKRSIAITCLVLSLAFGVTYLDILGIWSVDACNPQALAVASRGANAGHGEADSDDGSGHATAAGRTRLWAATSNSTREQPPLLRGRCVDARNQPIANCRVQITRNAHGPWRALFGPSTWKLREPVLTRADGTFVAFAPLPETDIELLIDEPGLATHRKRFVTGPPTHVAGGRRAP